MADNRRDLLEEESLLMHASGRPGKIEIRERNGTWSLVGDATLG
jgi:hypothetical protein